MSNNKKVEVIESLSVDEVAKKCGRDVSQIYQALTAGKLNEAQLPQWVGKKGILNDQKLKNFILKCRRLDENKKNKPVEPDPVKAMEERLAKKEAKAARAAEQVKKQKERLERMSKELTKE